MILVFPSPLVLDGRYCSKQPRPLPQVALATNQAAFVWIAAPVLAYIRKVYKIRSTFKRVALVPTAVMVKAVGESRASVLGVGVSIGRSILGG